MFYKTISGDTGTLPDGSEVPDGATEIDADEVAAIRTTRTPSPDAKQPIKAQIRATELQELAPRFVREYLLLKLAADFPTAYATNPAYLKLKALDDQIKLLRAQL